MGAVGGGFTPGPQATGSAPPSTPARRAGSPLHPVPLRPARRPSLRALPCPLFLAGRNSGHPKAEVEVPTPRHAPVAEGRAAALGCAVPAAAPEHPAAGALKMAFGIL